MKGDLRNRHESRVAAGIRPKIWAVRQLLESMLFALYLGPWWLPSTID
jgi:hypothetical protein